MRVASTCGDANTPRGKANFWISFSRAFISSSSAAGDGPASTCAVTQPNAVRGHFVFNFGSIVTFIAASACNRFQLGREVPQELCLVDYFVAADLFAFALNDRLDALDSERLDERLDRHALPGLSPGHTTTPPDFSSGASFAGWVRSVRFDLALVLNFMDSRPVAQLVRALP